MDNEFIKKNQMKCSSEDELEDIDDYEDDDEVEEGSEEIQVSYACEECDYRWEVTFEDEEEEALDEVQFCPMCGSANTTQI